MTDTGVFTAHVSIFAFLSWPCSEIYQKTFGGRATWGKTFGGYADADGNGHGTHVASVYYMPSTLSIHTNR